MIDNKYNIPKKLWNSFKSENAKKTFNYVFNATIDNQSNMTHLKQVILPDEQWKTLCHNFACEAAWGVDNGHMCACKPE